MEGDEGAKWIWARPVGAEGCPVKTGFFSGDEGLFEARMDAEATDDTVLFVCTEDI